VTDAHVLTTPNEATRMNGEENLDEIELTILMPCLNEAETLGICITKAQEYLARSKVHGEVLVADNGSTDASVEIAKEMVAHVVHVPTRGYGSALRHGIEAARGRFVVMGDADDSYDFSSLDDFIAELRAGHDLVVGNRFRGGIAKGAMPLLHRYFGNPALSCMGRVLFSINIGDFYCGLRAFRKDAICRLGLVSSGMEFALEMVIRSGIASLKITEVPTRLAQDGRSRPPHLRTWRDGWRSLRLFLLFSPRWLFLYPGLTLLIVGLGMALTLQMGPLSMAPNLKLDLHTLLISCMATIVGLQSVSFAVIARSYATVHGFLPRSDRLERVMGFLKLERLLVIASIIGMIGLAGTTWCLIRWSEVSFGHLEYGTVLRLLMPSITLVAISMQLVFTSFFAALLDIAAE
jgi:glycosyltransferase involved in cell wall biosynthesis